MVMGVNMGQQIIEKIIKRNEKKEKRVVKIGNMMMRGEGQIIMMVI